MLSVGPTKCPVASITSMLLMETDFASTVPPRTLVAVVAWCAEGTVLIRRRGPSSVSFTLIASQRPLPSNAEAGSALWFPVVSPISRA